MNRSSRKPKRFRLLSICANAVYNVIQSLKDISSIRFFLQRYTQNFVIRRRVLRVKKMTKFKMNTSLSLFLSTCRSVDALWFSRKDVHVPVSLSFSLHLHLQKRFRSRSDPNGIQERMFRQLKMHSCALESTQSVVQKPMQTIKWVLRVYIVRSHTRIQRGEFLSNTGPYPLIFSKLQNQHSTLGHHRHASETPFTGVSLAGWWWPAFSDIWILSPLKKKIKNVVRVQIQIRSEWISGKNVSSI